MTEDEFSVGKIGKELFCDTCTTQPWENDASNTRTTVEHTQQNRRALNSTNAKQADKDWATEISTLANDHTAANVPVLVT